MTTQAMRAPASRTNPQHFRKTILLILGCALIGAVFGYVIGGALKSGGTKVHLRPWTLVLIPITALLAIALHEAGHVVGGLVSGFRFYLYVAGPLRIERQGSGLKSRFNSIPSLWGGVASCAPAEGFGPKTRLGMLRFTAGGPLFSLLGAALLVPAFALRASSPNLWAVLLTFGILSAGIGLVTLVPMQLRGFTSDGARLLMLLRNRPEGQRWTAIGAVAGLAMVERPRDWPGALIEMLGDAMDPAPDSVLVCLLRHIWHVDRREWDLAGNWLDRGLANIELLPPPMQGGFYSVAASFYARHLGNAVIARDYLTRAQKTGLHDRNDLHAVSAAVLIAEGRHQEARVTLELASTSLKSKPPRLAAALREDIEELRAAIV